MNPGKGLVLDANILLRAVLNLVEGYMVLSTWFGPF
jgi:hypothetical protein